MTRLDTQFEHLVELSEDAQETISGGLNLSVGIDATVDPMAAVKAAKKFVSDLTAAVGVDVDASVQ
jgi:hypothetical protein